MPLQAVLIVRHAADSQLFRIKRSGIDVRIFRWTISLSKIAEPPSGNARIIQRKGRLPFHNRRPMKNQSLALPHRVQAKLVFTSVGSRDCRAGRPALAGAA